MDSTGTATLTYDAVQRLSSITYSTGKTVSYQYNGLNLVTRVTDPDANYISYSYNNVGGLTGMTTSADSQSTVITYDSLRRRSTTTYPTTANVVTTYTYDALNRITDISSVAGATTYEIAYSYVTNKNLVLQELIKLNGTTVSTIDFTYDSSFRVTEEKVTKAGPTVVYDKQYTWDGMNRRLTAKDVQNGNWLSSFSYDYSGRMTRITVTSGTGSNPFPWPKGTTNITCDGNGNITQLYGRNTDTGTLFSLAHEFDYEQRVVKTLLNTGDTVQNTFDGMGYRLKEVTTSGGTPTPVNLVPILNNRVIQQRDGTDAVTARFYWEGGQMFKKDHSTSSKYFVSEFRNSPFSGWNNAGTFNRYDLWDAFGVQEDSSGAGSLSPFQLRSNMLVDSSHLTASPMNNFNYPALGRLAQGSYRLKYQTSPTRGPNSVWQWLHEDWGGYHQPTAPSVLPSIGPGSMPPVQPPTPFTGPVPPIMSGGGLAPPLLPPPPGPGDPGYDIDPGMDDPATRKFKRQLRDAENFWHQVFLGGNNGGGGALPPGVVQPMGMPPGRGSSSSSGGSSSGPYTAQGLLSDVGNWLNQHVWQPFQEHVIEPIGEHIFEPIRQHVVQPIYEHVIEPIETYLAPYLSQINYKVGAGEDVHSAIDIARGANEGIDCGGIDQGEPTGCAHPVEYSACIIYETHHTLASIKNMDPSADVGQAPVHYGDWKCGRGNNDIYVQGYCRDMWCK